MEKPQAPPFWTVVRHMATTPTIRHVVAGSTLISFAGYAAIAWVPVYLQRVHGYSTGESGTILAIAIGLFGGLGTFFGGYFADRLARRNEGWRRDY